MRQRAFIPVDGCAENVHLLAGIIHEARRQYRPLYMASLDIAKAFDRVTKAAILEALRKKALHETFIKYVEDFYDTADTSLTFQGQTRLILPTRGVRQGDPMSPILFNLVLDGWLSSCSPEIGFRSGSLVVNAMAFADDLVVMASTPQGLQQQLDDLHAFLEPRGLDINCQKSFSVSYAPDGKRKISKIDVGHNFKIGDKTIPAVKAEDKWKYLGLTFSPSGLVPADIVPALKKLLQRATSAPLKPQQRLVLLRHYLLPRFLHNLVLGPVSIKMLTKLDKAIRAAVRQWLPHDAALPLFHATVKDGGLGISSLRTIPYLKKRRLAGLETSGYTACQEVAKMAYVHDELIKANTMSKYDNAMIRTAQQNLSYWRNKLYASTDGAALRGIETAPGATNWLREGTSLLTGRNFINLVKYHFNAMPVLARTKRGQNVPTQCRAGCRYRRLWDMWFKFAIVRISRALVVMTTL